MDNIILSVLMPALVKRPWQKMYDELLNQANPYKKEVEILAEVDDGKQSSGTKRQKLLNRSVGKYVCYVDDDDRVSDNYVKSIVEGCKSGADVVTFNLEMLNARKQKEIWRFGLATNNRGNGIMCVNHLCAWKATLARKVGWPPQLGYWDDHFWFEPLFFANLITTQFHINRTLYYYDYSAASTENQRRERIVVARQFATPNGVPCFKDHLGSIYIGDGGNCELDSMIRVRDSRNRILFFGVDELYHYHTIKVL